PCGGGALRSGGQRGGPVRADALDRALRRRRPAPGAAGRDGGLRCDRDCRPDCGLGSGAMTTKPLTIREVCDRFDLTPRTLRFWEQMELVRPDRDRSKRLYAPAHVNRVARIVELRGLGLPVETVRLVLCVPDEAQCLLASALDKRLLQLRDEYE